VFGERPSEDSSAFNPNLGTPTIYPDYVAFQSGALVVARVRSASWSRSHATFALGFPAKLQVASAVRFLADIAALSVVQLEFRSRVRQELKVMGL